MANDKKPPTDGLSGKMAIIERRIDHLKRRLDRLATDGHDQTATADFDRAEIGALTSALQCMRYVLNA